jgi:hypothetical protein
MHNTYYTPSGKFNPTTFLYLLIAICIAVPIVALIYTYAILYIPLIYLNFLCVIGIAFGIGYVASFVIGLGKVRNKLLAFGIGLILGLTCLYGSWLIWIHYYANQEFSISYMQLVENPAAFWDLVWDINKYGTWSIGRGTTTGVSGTMLTVVWIIEAIAIIAPPIFFAFSKAREPFIENDDVWADTTKIGPFEYIEDKKLLKKELETKNFQHVVDMQPATNQENTSHAILTLFHNKKRMQGNEFYLSVSNMKERIDKKNNLTYDEASLIQFIRIPAETGQQLLAKIGTKVVVSNATDEEATAAAE